VREPRVYFKNGIIIERRSTRILVDPQGYFNPSEYDVVLVTHGHRDHVTTHLGRFKGPIIMSRETKFILQLRDSMNLRGAVLISPGQEVDLGNYSVAALNAGHVLGSLMYVVDFGDYRVGVTGDFNVEDTNVTRGAEYMEVDMLIMESTYGSPEFTFPGREQIYGDIISLVEDNEDKALVFLGHPLGKGQELTMLLRRKPLYIQRNIKELNSLIDELGGVGKHLIPGVVQEGSVAIMGLPRDKESILEHVRKFRINDPILVLVSGFYSNPRLLRRALEHGLYAYPLSSHSDFRGLVEFALGSRARIIYTVYGRNVYFAKYLRTKYNIMARPIVPDNQGSILDYC